MIETQAGNVMTNAKRIRHKDRVVLSTESQKKIEAILENLKADLKGSKISRSELVNWIIEKQPAELPSLDRSNVLEKFYCPVKALEWASDKARNMKLGGQQVDLEILVSEILNRQPKPMRKKRSLK
jgi:hypothetical protein